MVGAFFIPETEVMNMSINAGSVYSELILDASKYEAGLKKAEEQMNTFASNLKKAGQSIEDAGKTMSKYITAPLVGIGTLALKIGMDFEAGMSEVQAISGATGDDLERLKEKAKEMGAATKFSASESAEALKYMAMAGWDTNDMLDGLEGIVMLAAASGEDLALTSDIVTDALTAFGMEAYQAGEFADLLASASSNSNTNVAMLGESFKYVAPLFGALGYSAEDAALALGLMANAGIKGSSAGTSLRAAITNLMKPTDSMAIAMEKLGIKVTDANDEMLPFKDLMNVLRGSFAGLTEEQQAQYAATIFGKEAMSGMLAIINASEEDYEKLTLATTEYTGTAKEMAEVMQDNLKGSITMLKSQLEGVGIQLSEILIPMAGKMIDKISEWVEWFGKLDKGTQQNIVRFAMFAAVIPPLLLVGGKLAQSISTMIGLYKLLTATIIPAVAAKVADKTETLILLGLYAKDAIAKGASTAATMAMTAATTAWNVVAGIATTVTTALGAAIAFLTSPIGIALVAIAALVAGVVHLWKTNEDFRNKVIELWNGMINFFKGIPETMTNIGKDMMQGLINGIKNMVSKVKNTVSNVANSITGTFKRILGISSPSKVMEGYGKNIVEGVSQGIDKNKHMVNKSAEDLARATISQLDKLGNAVITALRKRYQEEERLQLDSLRRQTENIRKETDERIKEYDRELAAKLKLLDDGTNEELKRLQEQIDGINNLTKQEEKELKEQEYQDRLALKEKELRQAKSRDERAKIQEELNRMIAEKEREQLLESRQQQIEALRGEMDRIRVQAQEKREELQKEYEEKKRVAEEKYNTVVENLNNEMEATKKHYATLLEEENLQAEARKLVLDENNKEMIELLDSYNPKWQDAGQSFGESLLNGLNSMKAPIQAAVDEILSMVSTAEMANARIIQQKVNYEKAARVGDTEGMAEAHRIAEELRKKGGTIKATDKLFGLAAGTNYWRGGLTWVGEQGPELIELPRGSKVYSNQKSEEMVKSSKGIIQNIVINSPTPLTPSDIARKNLQVSRQLAMEWGL